MALSRRAILKAGLAIPLLAQACPIRAEVEIGQARLSTVSDGYLVLPSSFIFAPMPQGELAEIRSAHGLDGESLTPECNLAILRDGARTVLFDAGSGPDFMPSAGKVLESLEALEISPEEITHVVFTHAHPDHIWGLLDEFDDLLFPEAVHMMGRAEWDYWWDPETVETIGEARAAFAVGARRRLEAIEDEVTFFDDGDEVLPGILAHATPGHTPGHMAFEVRQGSAAAMIVGDAIGNHHVAFERPSWLSGADQDPETAAETRLRLLDKLVTDDMKLLGFHLPQGGIGQVARDGDGFRFLPDKS